MFAEERSVLKTEEACPADNMKSICLHIRGIVQGVGFRPFIYKLAKAHGLVGWVCNRSGDVAVEVEGSEELLKRFRADIEAKAPPLAKIDTIFCRRSEASGYIDFEIRESIPKTEECRMISPDVSICGRCIVDIEDLRNRRHGYPFTNCTDCGPRFTIIKELPYDRENTTMQSFRMCARCRAEYEDPESRRFHAQPNACPKCGPRLILKSSDGSAIPGNPIIEAADFIIRGAIVAMKGLGGFLLTCDAQNPHSVNQLRIRKNRPHKPFAIMMRSIEDIKKYCFVSDAEAQNLHSPPSPIVLLRCKNDNGMGSHIAPNMNRLGIMLPYTPLHYLLMQAIDRPLVMTSGNLRQSPIIKDNADAFKRLSSVADLFLLHDRDISMRCDDSVLSVEDGAPRVIRRARGYAPAPIGLPFNAESIWACGGDLKNAFCLAKGEHAFVSQHIGDLEHIDTLDHFEDTLAFYRSMFGIQPEIVACDCHPDYHSSRFARRLTNYRPESRLVPVWHHHAHAVSCVIENRGDFPVLGVVCDGTGYGPDGRIWGGEFLLADEQRFKRLGHLEYMPLPGGDAAVLKPCRTAAGYIYELLGESELRPDLPFYNFLSEKELHFIKRQIKYSINTPLTSSAGRLFDAVSALIGIRNVVDYEAQAAIEMESAAETYARNRTVYTFDIQESEGIQIVKLGKLFQDIIKDVLRGTPPGEIAATFHRTFSAIIVKMCAMLRQSTGINRAALSGGVFQNRLLSTQVCADLESLGFTVYRHCEIPCNDGGISLGQAAVAHHTANKTRAAGRIRHG
ncbi:MAG: carbamoyltransferase HypF [Desulfobacterales bacterium]